MGSAASYVRRSCALDQDLRDRLTQQCSLIRECDQEDLPQAKPCGFQPKLCHEIGFCVCTEFPDALHMFHNCQRLFRQVFWRSRKNKTASPQRLLLEDCYRIVIEFKVHGSTHESTCDSDGGSDWESSFQNSIQDAGPHGANGLTGSVFLHVGKINFKTMHFAGVRLEQVEAPCTSSDRDLLVLRPYSSDESAVPICFTDVHLFTLLNLHRPWSLQVHTISLQEKDWAVATADSWIAVSPADNRDKFVIWQGHTQEANRRRVVQKTQNKRGPRKRPLQSSKQPKSKRSKNPGTSGRLSIAIENEQDQRDEQDPNQDDPLLTLFEESGQDTDQEIDGMINLYDDDNDEGDNSDNDEQGHPEDEVGLGLDFLVEESEREQEVSAAVEAEPDDDVFQEFLEEEAAGNIGNDPAFPSAEPPAPHAEPEPAPPLPAVGKRPHSRSTANRTVFVVPGGELHYYHLTDKMTAFCANRDTTHQHDCRKQLSTAGSRHCRSGRPVGFLMAWLAKRDEFDSRSGHVHMCSPSLEDRQRARRVFNELPESTAFARFEKKKERPTDPDEPVEL